MSKMRDTHSGAPRAAGGLNARSLALSALLGTRPPTLPASGLVALAELFGINGGAMRTALSRLVAAGDVTADGGRYSLADRLVARQSSQDMRADEAWNGDWHTAVATVDQRGLADRRQVRTLMANARFGELRPAIWARPANLPAPRFGADWLVTTGSISGTPPAELAARLWDLDELADAARAARRRLDEQSSADRSDPATIPERFAAAADVVRLLRRDPLLPVALNPAGWPFDELRNAYTAFERDLQADMRPFLTGSLATPAATGGGGS